jgi:hypothetical protein
MASVYEPHYQFIVVINCVIYKEMFTSRLNNNISITFIKDIKLDLNLSVCILLLVLDQVRRFPSNATIFQ